MEVLEHLKIDSTVMLGPKSLRTEKKGRDMIPTNFERQKKFTSTLQHKTPTNAHENMGGNGMLDT